MTIGIDPDEEISKSYSPCTRAYSDLDRQTPRCPSPCSPGWRSAPQPGTSEATTDTASEYATAQTPQRRGKCPRTGGSLPRVINLQEINYNKEASKEFHVCGATPIQNVC